MTAANPSNESNTPSTRNAVEFPHDLGCGALTEAYDFGLDKDSDKLLKLINTTEAAWRELLKQEYQRGWNDGGSTVFEKTKELGIMQGKLDVMLRMLEKGNKE